jgi:hypothetical protein
MSDDADAFPNAFYTYFSANTKRLLCIWHVLHAWALTANKLIRSANKDVDERFKATLMSKLCRLVQ